MEEERFLHESAKDLKEKNSVLESRKNLCTQLRDMLSSEKKNKIIEKINQTNGNQFKHKGR